MTNIVTRPARCAEGLPRRLGAAYCSGMLRVLLIVLIALCATTTAPRMTLAEPLRAVLVGVGHYPHLTDADLRGPPNDVRLMAETLIARGVAPGAITVLTTGPAGLPEGTIHGLPTRAAILAALDDLAAQARPGQVALFHFSGHGSQAPDRDGDEMGGYDEILLPMDAAGWRGPVGMVENAILDGELHDKVQAILDRGAQMVGILDACHSATGFRALGGAGVARTILPRALGIPADAPVAAPTEPRPPLRGEFVFLYSAQSDQRAFEYPLGDPADASGWYGAFTRQLAHVLRAAPQATWAQVLADASDAMQQGAAAQTPDGEGPMLTAPVFGTGAPDGMPRWSFAGDQLRAGLVQGLDEGALVAIHASATAPEALGSARLADLRADSARLQPEPGLTLPATGYARLAAPAPPPPLRLAGPLPQAQGDWAALLAEAVADDLADWTGGMADLVPVVLPDRVLAFAGPDGLIDPAGPGTSPRLMPGPGAAERLGDFLTDAAHALRLRRVLAGAAGAARGFTIGGPPLRMTVERRPGRIAAGGACDSTGAGATADPALGVGHCDELWLTITNAAARVQDVTVLYQDRAFALSAIWPVDGLSNRLAPGQSARVGLRIEAPGAAGLEEILVIAAAAEPGTRRADLTHLATPQRLRAGTPGLGAALADLMDGDRSRGFAAPALSPFSVLRQGVLLVPPARPTSQQQD